MMTKSFEYRIRIRDSHATLSLVTRHSFTHRLPLGSTSSLLLHAVHDTKMFRIGRASSHRLPASSSSLLLQPFTTRGADGVPVITPHPSDFDHHALRVARLNHGSFGACPKPVLDIQNEYRNIWLEQPDALYFSGKLHQGIRDAAIAAGTTLIPTNKILQPEHVCLTENATVAACAIAKKWGDELQTGDVIVVFDVAYKAMVNVLKEYCVSRGASLHVLHLPFLATTEEEIVEAIRLQMIDLPQRPKYAFLDHVSSQPAVCLPITSLIEIIRVRNCFAYFGRYYFLLPTFDTSIIF